MATRKTKSRQLKSLKEYRSLYARAKKAGLVTDKGDARSYKPTEYSKRRLRELEPFLSEEFGSVRVTPRIARQYKELFDERASRIKVIRNRVVLPKTSNQYVALRKGLPVIVTPLRNGTYEEIILPMRWKTINELHAILKDHPEWSALYRAGDEESYRFALGEGEPGNVAAPSHVAYESLQDMIDDLMLYDSFEGEGANEDVSGWVKLYRERADWKFPEYEKAQAKKAKQRMKDYNAEKKRRRAERISKLPASEQARIREREALRQQRRRDVYGERENAKRRIQRAENTGNIEEIRAKDRARKKKQRAERKAKGLPREPR
jgi:hypothetical protein